jgi:hypothetical protein
MTLLVDDLTINRPYRQLLSRGKQRGQQKSYEEELSSHEWITENVGKYYLWEREWKQFKQKKPLRKAQQL